MNCAIALQGKNVSPAPADKLINCKNSPTLLPASTGWNTFFTNPYEAECGPITSCMLKKKTCDFVYQGENLTIEPETGIIKAQQFIVGGWDEELCVQCENGSGSEVNYDGWKISQQDNCPPVAVVQAAVNPTSAMTLAYSMMAALLLVTQMF